ncbi:bifunctional glycosyltransferase family 2 protein/CDP-glycerol:glycerophosphate glycerophosphotransferase [Anaerosporobacter faecicola]|uniref:bifunctional glycosyltransferase family 2 protein/CDP-glycerol:glycerophosphate glycerophosphotransferase n=1 Tax=Anaerosporobacter faecicola TaxID=2718714 RepID=UPI00143AFD48|nr:bifunctional glycosyltransferase family 2 protein/CDP-glycerol:glycerophosphate glycerophosphotransferase [Anaerosporobacter faecicola]
MKVSIIIPFHRGIAFLEDCLTSLREQNYHDLETILVCDHIEEDINPLVAEYQQDLNLSVYHLDEKTGVAAARNLGLDKAQGEYVYFLDSDDYLYIDTLAYLIESTIDTDADIVYGKKKTSWFKRSVYMSTCIQNEDEENAEGDEENTALEEAQLNAENGNESESKSSIEEENGEEGDESSEDENDEELSEEELLAAEERRIRRKRERAHRTMITTRKGIRNVSVLNILMKRSVIEEHNIRFNEKFKFYSDLSFLVQVLEYATLYEKKMRAVYIKRKHNDSINLPALSQIREPGKFEEYIEAYYYTISLIPKDSTLRNRVDRKIINYYVKTFAPKLRRSVNDAWRNERFELLGTIVNNMNPEVIKMQKGYRKRLVKALMKGNLKKSQRLVNVNLGKKKLRKILTNRRALAKFLYIHSFLKKPMMDNWVICESFFGKSYSDSPKYIYEYLAKTYPGKYKFIWVINNKKSEIPYPHTKVKRFSIRYAYYLARCKYCVFNVRQPRWVRKREGNVFLETWHGTPLKRLVFDQDEVCGASPQHKIQFYKDSRKWDYLVSANYFSSKVFRSAFMYDKEMLEFGYPRNDILYAPDKEEKSIALKKKLGIPLDKKTILYAPTWRDDEFYGSGQYKFELKLDLRKMKQELGEEYVVLLRTHYYIADSLDTTGVEDFAFNLSKYDDIAEIYLISDLLITDYSSVFFDYANLQRPMLFFTYDLEKYRDVLRGFYIDMLEEIPGPLLYTSDEVLNAIKDIDHIKEEYSERYNVFYEKFCSLDDGHASENVAETVFNPKNLA